ncbi:hypothetical protein RFI_38336 [Reticulomyxa filosa]|uniref:Uncharacterized protein n=1 Tax=Reticulomyxa filosa TaxID=46433 RepID=X6LEF9_RETFI|nr:hypothetical protein RFI_38336 [Reticulomyxa filosa]|eukprot:ETN99144.1 hypothetical protein RFI_38336 [Reticulomyxa filosa]
MKKPDTIVIELCNKEMGNIKSIADTGSSICALSDAMADVKNNDKSLFKKNFYVVPNLPHNFILSRSALSQLGYALMLEHEKFDHVQSDEILEDQNLEHIAELHSDAVGLKEKIECHNIDIGTITQNKLVESLYEPLHEYKCTLRKQLQFVSDGALLAQRKYNTKSRANSFEKIVHVSKLLKLYIENENKESGALFEQEFLPLEPLDKSNMPL